MIKSILKKCFCVVCVCLLIFVIGSHIANYIECRNIKEPGKLVDVNGENMHIYTEGEGENIILLSGFGTVAPSLDFNPLIDELKNYYKVTVVENFGYGYSDKTDKERSVENIVEETRIALKKAGIDGPYILMPHSLGGVYSQYYAAKYPEEVKEIIMLDTTIVKYLCNNKEKVNTSEGSKLKLISNLAHFVGIDRFYYKDMYKDSECFNNNEKDMMVRMAIKNPFNKTLANEGNMIVENCETVNKIEMPKDLSILKLIAIDDIDKINEEFYKDELEYNEQEFEGMNNVKCKFMEGGHYLHYTKAKEIAEEIKNFSKS